MKRMAPFVGALACLAVACSHDTGLHLVAEATAAPADIRITNGKGTATWTWGSKSFSEHVELLDAGAAKKQKGNPRSLRIRLANGAIIQLVAQHTFYICEQGCEKVHMPVNWTTAAYE
jgi:hypothetical protein